jgi:hypothetical protein
MARRRRMRSTCHKQWLRASDGHDQLLRRLNTICVCSVAGGLSLALACAWAGSVNATLRMSLTRTSPPPLTLSAPTLSGSGVVSSDTSGPISLTSPVKNTTYTNNATCEAVANVETWTRASSAAVAAGSDQVYDCAMTWSLKTALMTALTFAVQEALQYKCVGDEMQAAEIMDGMAEAYARVGDPLICVMKAVAIEGMHLELGRSLSVL